MDQATDRLAAFGIALDEQRQSLRVGGARTVLDSRSFRIFQVLAAAFGQPVTKDKLLAEAWPDQLVHENSLAKAISKLRPLLADSKLEIAASYGIGYILRERPGEWTETPAAPLAGPLPPARAAAGFGSTWRVAAGVAVLALLAGAVVAVQRAPDPVPVRTSPPLTADPPDAVATILWVDDNPSNNRLEVELFKSRGIAVHLAEGTEDALKLLAMNEYRLVISDLGRGDDRLAGLHLSRRMKELGLTVPVIIYTIRPDGERQQRAQRQLVAQAGAADLALTPVEVRAKVLARVDQGS